MSALHKNILGILSGALVLLTFFPSLVQAQTCGNNSCELLETCLTCSTDCGSCTGLLNSVLPTQVQQLIPSISPGQLFPIPTIGTGNNEINLFPNSSTGDNSDSTGQPSQSSTTSQTTETIRTQFVNGDPSTTNPRPTIIALPRSSIIIRNRGNSQGYINLKPENAELIFTPEMFTGDVEEWFIVYPQVDISVTFNFQALMSENQTGQEVLLPQKITINKPLGDKILSVVLPANTIIGAKNLQNNQVWDGTFEGPRFLSVQEACPAPNEADSILQIGREDMQITFSRPVEMRFPQRGTQSASYCFARQIRAIPTGCTQPNAQDCLVNQGNDLVLNTNHFTQFFIYKKPPPYLLWFTIAGITLFVIGGIVAFLHLRKKKRKKEKEKISGINENMSTIVHELKTPLTAIQGFTHMILGGTFGPVEGKVKKPLKRIISSSNNLLTMIDDTLNLSRLESKHLTLHTENFPIHTLVDDVIKNLAPLVHEKKIKLHQLPHDDIWVHADKEKVKQILTNLIGNAIKFTDTGSVTVSTTQNNTLAKISVQDTGKGIEKKDQKNLFKKFHRVEGKGKQYPGTGLGLYISLKIAHKMKGDLYIERSELNEGTTFVLILPLAALRKK